jgi:hypothetical protein
MIFFSKILRRAGKIKFHHARLALFTQISVCVAADKVAFLGLEFVHFLLERKKMPPRGAIYVREQICRANNKRAMFIRQQTTGQLVFQSHPLCLPSFKRHHGIILSACFLITQSSKFAQNLRSAAFLSLQLFCISSVATIFKCIFQNQFAVTT